MPAKYSISFHTLSSSESCINAFSLVRREPFNYETLKNNARLQLHFSDIHLKLLAVKDLMNERRRKSIEFRKFD